jgi:hypothetical protein
LSEQNHSAIARLTLADVLAGLRTLLLPIAAVGGLVAVGHMFRDTAAPADATASFAAIPQQAWLWALIAYVAAMLPRHPLSLRIPGVPPMLKALIWAIAGAGFCLEWRFHDAVEPFMGAALALVFALGCVLSAGSIIRAERLRRDSAEQAKDQALEQMILDFERLNNRQIADPAVTHPALFAEVSGIVNPNSPLGTSIWFLRPHPALNHKRPIDVLQEQGGEDKLLRACKLGPNT